MNSFKRPSLVTLSILLGSLSVPGNAHADSAAAAPPTQAPPIVFSNQDNAKLTAAQNGFASFRTLSAALSAGCTSATSDPNDQARCMALGKQWMLKYLLGPGQRIPCTPNEIKFDLIGLLENACGETFGKNPKLVVQHMGFPIGDMEGYPELPNCLGAAFYPDLQNAPKDKDGWTSTTFSCQNGPALVDTFEVRLSPQQTTIGIDTGMWDGNWTSCMIDDLNQEKSAAGGQLVSDQQNLGIQMAAQSCESAQNSAVGENTPPASSSTASSKVPVGPPVDGPVPGPHVGTVNPTKPAM